MRVRPILVMVVSVAVAASCSSSSDKKSSPTPTSAKTAVAPPTGGSKKSVATTSTVPAAQVAARASKGCAAAAKVPAGEVKVNTTSEGVARWYYRFVPTSYVATEPMPVVLDLHGYIEGATIHKAMSAMGPFGDQHGFITITPQGSGTAVALWNTGDMKFIGNLLDEVEGALCVDERRVFVTGLSMGAFMTSAVSCAYSDRIAAAAPIAGIRNLDDCVFKRPVPVIAFHGTADPLVAYTGGFGPGAMKLPTPDGTERLGDAGRAKDLGKGPSIPTITAAWAKRNGCGTKPVEEKLTADVTRLVFPCPAGDETELDRITGGGHSWPGSEFSKMIGGVVGSTTTTISANAVMWAFFEAHPLRS